MRELLHGCGAAEAGAVRGEAGVELLAGVGDGVAVEIAGCGGCGRGGVGHSVGCCFADEDVGEGHAEGLGGDHGHLGVQALAHLCAAVGDEDGTIVIDVHERAGLIEEDGGEGDAELGWDDG